MQRLAVINVVGLTKEMLGVNTPNISAVVDTSSVVSLNPPLPAVTCTVQSSLLTGESPRNHGIVANGWYERETAETHFWRQSNNLVQGKKVWDKLHDLDRSITIANMFWWFNMYSNADYSVTPRPMYPADGRKIPDVWTHPRGLRDSLQERLGQFPLFSFWGPMASIKSTEWIVDASIEVDIAHTPTLMLVYIPHLDYPLQRLGPNHPDIAHEIKAVDVQVGKLVDHFKQEGVQVCILSEYGVESVDGDVPINRILRKHGYLSIRNELGKEYLDAGASDAFAVPDHQIAHVYVRKQHDVAVIAKMLHRVDGIEHVLVEDNQAELSHERSGDIVVVSNQGKWFSHDWWEDLASAPDYQPTVDIHRKPGYDPRELILSKGWRGSKARIALKLFCKKLGSRTLLDVITLDPNQVRGSHGRTPTMGSPSPIVIPPRCAKHLPATIQATDVAELMITWITS